MKGRYPRTLTSDVCRCGHGFGWHRCDEIDEAHGNSACGIDRMYHKDCLYLAKLNNNYGIDCNCKFFHTNNLEYLERKYEESLKNG